MCLFKYFVLLGSKLKMSPKVCSRVWVDDDLPSLLLSLRGSLDFTWSPLFRTRNRYLKRNQQPPMDHKKEKLLECGGCPNQLTKTLHLFEK